MKISLALAVFAAAVCSFNAAASPMNIMGVVQGTWSNPVLAGNIVDGATGAITPTDNTRSAACDIAGCPNGVGATFGADTLVWGITPESSSININGHFINNVPLNTPFDAATITYFNGSSLLTSQIFGATLNLRFCAPFQTPSCPQSTATDVATPLSIFVNIVTTANTGTAAQNADWVGPFGTPQTLTFNVYEEQTATAELWGKFVGDPQFQPTLLVSTSPNGFIGNGQWVQAAPEPGGLAIVPLGLGVLVWARRRTAQRLTAFR